jgi:hypothetical protein
MVKKKVTKPRTTKRSVSRRSVANVPPYGDPIRQAIAQGEPAAMRQMSVAARRWIATTEKQLADAKKALEKLDATIRKL